MATTEDWALAEQRSARWRIAEQRAAVGDMNCQCLLDLRRRVEALEQRAAAPEPAPAADRPLWEVMAQARYNSDGPRMASVRLATAAEIDAVAEWLDARGYGWDAVAALHAEARRAREGA